MKIVILGAKGMLGRDLGRVFYDWNPYLLDKEDLDITDNDGVGKFISRLRPDVVINAAACTDVDWCETNRDVAQLVNGEAPGYIAKAAKDVGAIFVHYSTDYVFDGNKAEGYSEDDEPDLPVNFYGETKLVGENAVRKAGGNYYVIRTSWLFGHGGGAEGNGKPENFAEKILQAWKEKGQLRVVSDQHGKPTFALDVAKKTRELVEGKKSFGTYHIVNEPATTRYAFAKKLIELSGGDASLVFPCASDEFPRPAKRPQYSILLNTKLPPLRNWHEALAEYLILRE